MSGLRPFAARAAYVTPSVAGGPGDGTAGDDVLTELGGNDLLMGGAGDDTLDGGDGIVRLVSETACGWDARTITRRLENAVGRDLQYIRINGTLVGGLVGLTIHAVDVLL